MRPCIIPRPIPMAASHSLSRDKEWAENAPRCGALRVPSLLRPISDTRATGYPYPGDAGFSSLKIRLDRPHRLGAAGGVTREDEEKKLSTSTSSTPRSGAREHRKPCGLAPKGA